MTSYFPSWFGIIYSVALAVGTLIVILLMGRWFLKQGEKKK